MCILPYVLGNLNMSDTHDSQSKKILYIKNLLTSNYNRFTKVLYLSHSDRSKAFLQILYITMM